eukprot:m.125742 g.125742  ORF g.125742 m.125742 type:complete len:573 (-) comp15759_c0_seq4:2105-3823(-)
MYYSSPIGVTAMKRMAVSLKTLANQIRSWVVQLTGAQPLDSTEPEYTHVEEIVADYFSLLDVNQPGDTRYLTWHCDRRTKVGARRGKKKLGRQQVKDNLTNTFAAIFPALQAEYPPQAALQSPTETNWRQVDHLKLGRMTLPLLELLEADDRLRKRQYVIGAPTANRSHGQRDQTLETGDWSLADVALFAVVHLYSDAMLEDGSWTSLPNLCRWYQRMGVKLCTEGVIARAPDLAIACTARSRLSDASFTLAGSYIKTEDAALHKPANRLRHQKRREATASTATPRLAGLELSYTLVEGLPLSISEDLLKTREAALATMWTVPGLNPAAGDVKAGKTLRKQQQLVALCRVIVRIAQPGQRLLEFGGGGGHLALCLAYLLPECTVVLLDRNIFALSRGLRRARTLGLRNVTVCVADMVDFRSTCYPFDLGVGLHFCGLLTDLAVDACMQAKANFVLAPCCYGKVCMNHHSNEDGVEQLVHYPRSHAYQERAVTTEEYYSLASLADFDPGMVDNVYDIESNGACRARRFMGIVDSDRLRYVKETDESYQTYLMQLQPLTCTPKSDVIVGALQQT